MSKDKIEGTETEDSKVEESKVVETEVVETKDVDRTLSKERLHLLKKQNFYGNLLYLVHITWGEKIPTAGVWVDSKVNMCINPKFWAGLTETQRVGILKHELDHLLMDHISRARSEKDVSNAQKVNNNIAMDLAINELNPYLDGAGACLVTEFNEKYDIKMERYREYEYYKKWVDKIAEEHGEFSHEFDDHSKMSDGDAGDEEISREALKQALETARDRTSGDVPDHVDEQIRSLGSAKLTWRAILRRFVARNRVGITKITRSRRNRRMGLVEPGKRNKPKLHIAVCVDTSASVPENKLAEFATEIEKIAQICKVTMIEADYAVQRVTELKKSSKIGSLKGRGGTSYEPGLEKALELNADCVIYFGDGDPAPSPRSFKLPLLWVLTDRVKRPTTYGSEIYL